MAVTREHEVRQAAVARPEEHLGFASLIVRKPDAGTHETYRKRLGVILAGRVGEELVLGTGALGAEGEPEGNALVPLRGPVP